MVYFFVFTVSLVCVNVSKNSNTTSFVKSKFLPTSAILGVTSTCISIFLFAWVPSFVKFSTSQKIVCVSSSYLIFSFVGKYILVGVIPVFKGMASLVFSKLFPEFLIKKDSTYWVVEFFLGGIGPLFVIDEVLYSVFPKTTTSDFAFIIEVFKLFA